MVGAWTRMFSIEHLHQLRRHELKEAIPHLGEPERILEIGGGTGYQAQILAQLGLDVVAIDLPTSQYKNHLVHPVMSYDGIQLPFADQSFNAVFSSNVLEHVEDLGTLHQEIRRVLKPNGFGLHVMPSASWRFWESVAHYLDLTQRSWILLKATWNGNAEDSPDLRPGSSPGRTLAVLLKSNVLPERHGVLGNVVSEIWWFSRRSWCNRFASLGFRVEYAEPIRLFYTGRMVLGRRWSIASRVRASRFLGSSPILYKVVPA